MAEKELFPSDANGNRPTAYSYVRFSTKKQELGDSLRRQVEAAQRFAKEHRLVLAERTFRDLGVSGFKQRNVKQGALAAFIGAVKSGLIAPGSILLIEQFDRLSRAEINVAFRLLLDLVEMDITVVTLVDDKIWNSETVQDVANVLTSVILMSRAHEESKAKARRLAEVWGQKKQRAAVADATGARRIVTSECPRWLEPNADKTGFVVRQEEAESVRRIFAARINGYGINSIVTRANKENWPVPGKAPLQRDGESDADYEARKAAGLTWHTSTVGRLLRNRAVLGEYQPHKIEHVKVKDQADKKVRLPSGEPIPGYFPAIIDETTFLRAQAKADRSGRFPGRRDASLKNWLQGILRCNCGHSMVRKNKNSLAQPGYARYYCTARNRGTSQCPGASALELENAVLEVISGVAPQFYRGTHRAEELKAKADLLEVDLSAAKQTRDRFLEAIAASNAPVKSLTQRLSEAEATADRLEHELAAVQAELADLDGDTDTVFENIRRAVESVDSLDARAKLREDLSRIIEKAVVHQDAGYIEVHLRGGDVPISHPLGERGLPPGSMAAEVPSAEGFVPGLPSGLTITPLDRQQQAAYLERLEREESTDDPKEPA